MFSCLRDTPESSLSFLTHRRRLRHQFGLTGALDRWVEAVLKHGGRSTSVPNRSLHCHYVLYYTTRLQITTRRLVKKRAGHNIVQPKWNVSSFKAVPSPTFEDMCSRKSFLERSNCLISWVTSRVTRVERRITSILAPMQFYSKV